MSIRIHRTVFGALLALALSAAPALAADKTTRVWQAKCASGHGDDGKAQTAKGKEQKTRDVTTKEWQKDWTDEKIKKVIEDGVDGEREGVKKHMDGYKDKLKPEQVDDLVKFMRGLAAK